MQPAASVALAVVPSHLRPYPCRLMRIPLCTAPGQVRLERLPAQARLLDGYEPVGLVKLDRGRAGATGRRLERKGHGGSGMGASAGYAVTTHARTCSSVAPAS